MPTGNLGFFTVNANGTITNNFTGHIHADGLDLYAGTTASPPDDRKIRWLRQADGALVAVLSAYEVGTRRTLTEGTGNGAASSTISTISDNTTNFSTAVTIDLANKDGTIFGATIVNGVGGSSFIKAPGLVSVSTELNSGQIAYTFNGTVTTQGAALHGLSKTPTEIIMTQQKDAATTPPIVYQTWGYTSTGFSWRGYSVTGAFGGAEVASWVAVAR